MQQALGIILKHEDFRERDERVVLYTREFGKISVVAKGVKRIEAKLRGSIDIFNIADILFVEGRNFFILTAIDAQERFPHIAKDPSTYRSARAATDIVEKIYEENAQDENICNALHSLLLKLDEFGKNSEKKNQNELFSWLLLKKFQSTVITNQGYSGEGFSSSRGPVLSPNALTLLRMLNGGQKAAISLKKRDLQDIEEIFTQKFAYFFNMEPASWVPYA